MPVAAVYRIAWAVNSGAVVSTCETPTLLPTSVIPKAPARMRRVRPPSAAAVFAS
jgi:hypothetical protein